ncbi:MAG: lamin tail domain-containing protein [Candidatus Staskawiczbacteria bacterium]|nr:lamin tail domain-containing protein [Candidatus Staskawiczbacteria bacterium]
MMKFARFLFIFLILVSIFGFRYVFDLVDAKLFGASLISLISPQNELEGEMFAYAQPEEPNSGQEIEVPEGRTIPVDVAVENTQDKIDDILEKIDILQQQLLEVDEVLEVDDNQDEPREELEEEPDEQSVVEIVEAQQNVVVPNVVVATVVRVSNSGTTYPKIVISEVQIAGLEDSKQEFVELYNLHDQEIDLTGWYLQRKTKSATSFSTFAPSTLLAGKKISAYGYFLIAREGSMFAADILVDHPLTEDNALALKNPNGEISDKVGFGQAQDYELLVAANPPAGVTIGRKIVADQPYDTDNNEADFEMGQPTPKAKNIAYVTPVLVDILAPAAAFTLDAIQKSLIFNVDFSLTDIANVVSPSGLDVFTFRSKEEQGDWQEDTEQKIDGGPTSIQISREVTGQDEKSYYFQVKAKDAVGNESLWLPENPATTKISLFKNILINELQADGQTTKDEFIKLYNPHDVAVDLAGFALTKKTASGTESNLVSSGAFSGIIEPTGYFLIAPQDNEDGTKNYMGVALPDLRYSGSSFSFTIGNTIFLYSADGQLLDQMESQEPESEIEPGTPASPELVVINEIAWMGTVESATNEWVELFNPGDQDVNLSGWRLAAADGTPNIALSGIISAHGFYLLERIDDNSVPEITADKIYTGALVDSGENLLLTDSSGIVVDQVNAIPWFAGNNSTNQTMQRKDPLVSGNSADNWQTSQEEGGSPKL